MGFEASVGRDFIAGVPKVLETSSSEIREALLEPVHAIVETVHQTLEKTPPELPADIVDRGTVLVGGVKTSSAQEYNCYSIHTMPTASPASALPSAAPLPRFTIPPSGVPTQAPTGTGH